MRHLLLPCLVCSALTATALSAPPNAPAAAPNEGRAVPVMARVVWPEHDLSKAVLRVCTDPECRKTVVTYPTGGARGDVAFALDPGTYYLMAFADQDGDSRVGPGDGLGFFGVVGPGSRPRPLTVDEGAGVITLTIPIAFKIGADGKTLEPVPVKSLTPYSTTAETRLSGTVTGALDDEAPCVVILAPASPVLPARATLCAADGTFSLGAIAGPYVLLAVQDLDRSGTVNCGDLIALADYEFEMGTTIPLLEVQTGKPREGMSLDLRWILDREGRLRTGDGELLGPRLNVGGLPGVCMGAVMRAGKPVPACVVRAYADEGLKELVAFTKTDAEGRFCLGLVPGSYYLMAIHDADNSQSTGPGDELGFFGVDAPEPEARPQMAVVEPGQLSGTCNIVLTMSIGEDGKPQGLVLTAP